MIPAFNAHGVLPPEGGQPSTRAPYDSDMVTFCQHFGTTGARRELLRGLLEFRGRLRTAGLNEGFQWLNGSFAEDVERLRGRSPADIDVVTFTPLGSGEQQNQLYRKSPELFSPSEIKNKYRVDHYFVSLDGEGYSRKDFVTTVSYWYSMWAHQRDSLRWKGFVSVMLSSNDQEAQDWLNAQALSDGGSP